VGIEPLDLLRELRPTIVHLNGHGARPTTMVGSTSRDVVAMEAPPESTPGGLVVHGANGRSQRSSRSARGAANAAETADDVDALRSDLARGSVHIEASDEEASDEEGSDEDSQSVVVAHLCQGEPDMGGSGRTKPAWWATQPPRTVAKPRYPW
jgi:hypothetical protein